MAVRPVFRITNKVPYYIEDNISFQYYNGFAEIQKIKCINSLHKAFLEYYPDANILEISSKSQVELGRQISAFNLLIKTPKGKQYSVESAFQASKVFTNGGPYKDILEKTSKDAKRDIRLKSSGTLKYFHFGKRKFELIPRTYFYNWLYINALSMHQELGNDLLQYDSFTDIVFNPKKSLNCQARAAAIYVSLRKLNILNEALESEEKFLNIVYGDFKRDDTQHQVNIWD